MPQTLKKKYISALKESGAEVLENRREKIYIISFRAESIAHRYLSEVSVDDDPNV
jgi:hypothetical protein